jgi:hypothetical protein
MHHWAKAGWLSSRLSYLVVPISLHLRFNPESSGIGCPERAKEYGKGQRKVLLPPGRFAPCQLRQHRAALLAMANQLSCELGVGAGARRMGAVSNRTIDQEIGWIRFHRR